MIVKPKVRDFICTTAHPSGCFENVKKQVFIGEEELKTVIGYIKKNPSITEILVSGGDTLSGGFEKQRDRKSVV